MIEESHALLLLLLSAFI